MRETLEGAISLTYRQDKKAAWVDAGRHALCERL